MASATTGNKAVLAINTGTPTTPIWTPCGEVSDISQTRTNKTADVTTLASDEVETIVTIKDNGKYSLTLNYNTDDAGALAMSDSFDAGTKLMYKLTLAKSPTQTVSGNVYAFSAIVDEFADTSNVSSMKQITTKASLTVMNLTKTLGS